MKRRVTAIDWHRIVGATALFFAVLSLTSLTTNVAQSQPAASDQSARSTRATADNLFHEADTAETNHKNALAIEKYMQCIKVWSGIDVNSVEITRAKARIARLYLEQVRFDKAEPLYRELVNADHKKKVLNPELMVDLDDLSDNYMGFEHDKRFGLTAMMHTLTLRQFINPHHPHIAESYRQLTQFYLVQQDLKRAAHWAELAVDEDGLLSRQKQSALVFDMATLASIYRTDQRWEDSTRVCNRGLAVISSCSCGQKAQITFKTIMQQNHDLSALAAKKGRKSAH